MALTNSKTDQLSPPIIDVGIDLSEFYMSVEWDILQVTCQYVSRVQSKNFYVALIANKLLNCFKSSTELKLQTKVRSHLYVIPNFNCMPLSEV